MTDIVNDIVIHIISHEFKKSTLRNWAEDFREELVKKAERNKKEIEVSIGVFRSME